MFSWWCAIEYFQCKNVLWLKKGFKTLIYSEVRSCGKLGEPFTILQVYNNNKKKHFF